MGLSSKFMIGIVLSGVVLVAQGALLLSFFFLSSSLFPSASFWFASSPHFSLLLWSPLNPVFRSPLSLSLRSITIHSRSKPLSLNPLHLYTYSSTADVCEMIRPREEIICWLDWVASSPRASAESSEQSRDLGGVFFFSKKKDQSRVPNSHDKTLLAPLHVHIKTHEGPDGPSQPSFTLFSLSLPPYCRALPLFSFPSPLLFLPPQIINPPAKYCAWRLMLIQPSPMDLNSESRDGNDIFEET